jgi:PKD repeat protein
LTVIFTDQSTGTITARSWDFGDDNTSTATNPSHIYAEGIYTVALTVTGPGGTNTNTKQKIITVGPTPAAPVAQFSATPTTGPAPQNVAFTDQSTGTISTWSWDFGDGGTSALQSPTHNYATGGTYTVALTTTGPGGSNTNTKAGFINITPVAQFLAAPTTGVAPLTVDFTDQSTGGATSWSWDFGDGGTSTLQSPSHTYAQGSYTVALTATGPGGSNTNTKPGFITVGPTPPVPPVAAFSATPTTGIIPLTVAFTDQSTGSISTWSWDFGDGGTSTLQSPSHDYVTAGTYTVSLTTTGPGGTNTNTKAGFITATTSVFTDDFNRADANPIGGNWTTAPGCRDMQIISNGLFATVDNSFNCAYWNANAFTGNQYSQVRVGFAEPSKGPAVRIQTGAVQQNFYYAKIDNTVSISIKKNVNGSFSTIGASFTVPALQSTDIIKLSAVGTTLELFVNGVSQGTRTDSDFTSGVPGIWNFQVLSPLDDWEGGSL